MYDNTKFIKDLYADWYVKEARWHYHAKKGPTRDTKTELFISNKPFKKYTRSSGITGWV